MIEPFTLERASKVLSYDPETGVFTWLVSRGGTRAGDVAGSVSDRGYGQVTLDRVVVKAHRLAWLFITGSWPDKEIDHINGDKRDNRAANLRLAERWQNIANTSGLRGRTLPKGVYLCKRNDKVRKTVRYMSTISAEGKAVYLGTFSTPEEASAAYQEAVRQLHGEFAHTPS